MNTLLRSLAVKGRRGLRLKHKEKVGFRIFFYVDKRKTSMFIGKEESTSRNGSLGCKHIVS